MWSVAALWIGMSVCVPTYMLGSGLVAAGMGWWGAAITVTLGNLIVLLPMILNGYPGAAHGIPFPVLLRASFGIHGAHIGAVMRALVACGWFGIQTYLGGEAIYILAAVLFHFPQATAAQHIPMLDLSPGELICFTGFWLFQLAIIVRGMESIRWLEVLAAPLLIAVGVGLLVWAIVAGGGWSAITAPEVVHKLNPDQTRHFWVIFPAALTGMVGFWSTLSLNISDITRYARSQRAQALGQAVGLPTTMGFYAFIGIIVTLATVVVFGEPVPDPIKLLGKFDSPVIVVISMVMLAVATISTNLAANVISPANTFSNIYPSKISFRTGGIITAFIGVVMMPWKLLASLGNYLFSWLVGYSALLGPVAGIMICDYFVLRRGRVSVVDLYRSHGRYRYKGGINPAAILALILGVAPSVPGFVNSVTGRTHQEYRDATHQIDNAMQRGMTEGQIEKAVGAGDLPHVLRPFFPEVFDTLYTYAWFVGFIVAFVAYAGLMFRSTSVRADLERLALPQEPTQ